jgi:sugar lactone lactonase YvrE
LQISGLTVDPQGRLILAPEAQPYLYRVDLATGDRAIINNPDYVPGGMFATIDLALDADQSLVAIRYDGIFRFAAGATWGSTLVEYYRDGTYYRGFVMPAVPGDADFDDAVTGADYTYWADHFQQSAIHGARDGDFNRDGVVDGADYTIWADNFQSATGAAIAVPEPSAWRLIVLGGVLTLMARWAKARWTKACVPAAGVLLLSAVGAGSMVEAATIAPRSILGMDYGVGVVDGDLVALDQLSGQITTIAQSSPEDGVFDRVRSISWSPEGGGAAYLLRGTPGWRAPAVPRVDTSTGAITYAYELNQQGQPVNPNGPALANPLVMAREPSGMLLIADSYGRLIRLDPNSGARAMLSDDTHGNGPLFNDYLFGLTVLPQGSIFVAGLHAGAIFQVDPVTGDRQIVSGAGVGAGPEFGPLQSVFMDTQHSLIVNTFREGQVFGQFYRVDIATGERTLLPVVGQPPPAADAFAVDADRTILMSTVIGEIYRYDPTTGTTIRLEYDYGAPRFDGYAIVPALPGDGDLDNAVTAEDYTIWSDSLRQAAPRGARDGDFNRDGVVDGADYTLWADNFQPVATAAIAVPEPATLSLLIAACAGYCLHAVSARRRRKARSASRSAV